MLKVVKNAKSENLEYEIYLWISHGYLKTQFVCVCVCVCKISTNFYNEHIDRGFFLWV